jgi:hypothetical protein
MPLFDPMREWVDIQLLWAKFHSLPLEVLSKMTLTLINNKLGRMLDIDEKSISLDRKSMAKICMEVKHGDGISYGSGIQVGDRLYRQEIDYVNVMFRCSIYHLYGNIWCT